MNKDKENIESATEAKPPSDTKILLAPLGRYALIGLFIVAVIVTTAIMLDDQFNNIDREMASLNAELQKANQLDQAIRERDTDAVDSVEGTTEKADELIAAKTVPVMTIVQPSNGKDDPKNTAGESTEMTLEKADTDRRTEPADTIRAAAPAYPAPAYYPPPPAFIINDRYLEERIAAGDAFLQERLAEREQWVSENRAFMQAMQREFQVRSLESMQEQLTRRQQRIEEMEKRFQETYEMRAAEIQRRKEERFRAIPDRI